MGGVRASCYLAACLLASVLLAMGPAAAQDPPAPEQPAVPAQPAAAEAKVDAQGVPLVSNVFFDTDLRQALSDVAASTGKMIIPDQSVQGFVSLELKDVPLDKTLDFLLLAGGYIWDEVEPGVYLVTSPDPELPSFRRIAQTQLVSLTGTPVAEMSRILPESYAAFVRFDQAGNRVVVTAPKRMLAQIVDTIKQLDKPVSQQDVSYRAAAIDLVNIQTADLAITLGESYKSIVQFDAAANRVLLNGPVDQVTEAEARIKALDTASRTTRIVPLANMTGASLLALLPTAMQPYVKVEQDGNRAIVDAPNQLIEAVVAQINALDAGATTTLIAIQNLSLDYVEAKELTTLLPEQYKAVVRVDEAGRQAVLMGTPQLVQQAAAYIESIDTPPLQIMIEALVVETEAGALDKFQASAQSENIGFDAAAGVVSYIKDAATILYRILNLVSQNQASVKASPRVVAQEGKEANVRVSVEQYFRIVTARQNYDYVELQAIEAAIGLTITPRVAEKDRMVTCTIAPEVSDVTATSADNLPIITKRTAATTVRVRDGEVIAIGGLLEEMIRETTSKIPVLGDIPLIGELFKTHNKEKSQREVTIFIVPHILDDDGNFEGGLIFEGMNAAPPADQPVPTTDGPARPGTTGFPTAARQRH